MQNLQKDGESSYNPLKVLAEYCESLSRLTENDQKNEQGNDQKNEQENDQKNEQENDQKNEQENSLEVRKFF